MPLKLGKQPAQPKPTDLKFTKYAKSVTLPTVPLVFGFGKLYKDGEGADAWQMLGNGPDETVYPGFDGAGDCVLAGAAHETKVVNKARHGRDVPFDGHTVLVDYGAITGYVIGDPSTDNGTDMHDAARYRKNIGIADSTGLRHKISAYVWLEPGNFEQAVEASYIFGLMGVGFEFPNSAWDQFDAGEPWDNVDDDQIDGGHYVPGEGSVHSPDELTVVTWAKRQMMTKSFYEKYVDEAVAYLSDEMIRSDGRGLHGWDLEQFKADLAAL